MTVDIADQLAMIVDDRNLQWAANPDVPAWVDLDTVGLDQFFTRSEVATRCHQSLLSFMAARNEPIADYLFVEPSAGTGAFYDLLPPGQRFGIDLAPLHPEVDQADFLTWSPPASERPYAVVGNPPFGYRAWLALAFINRAARFANYVGLILPMAFQSDGKGSPKHRVRGLRLVHSEPLPVDSFVDANGRPKKINALWQIWQRGVNDAKNTPTCDSWAELFTVDNRAERRCGQTKMHQADYFLQRTFFDEPPSLVLNFDEVRYVCGYGIIIKRDREAVAKALHEADWTFYSNLAAHNCRHISMYHIRKVLTDAGFRDA